MLKTENAAFEYEPYPVCYIPNVLDESLYQTLTENYPSQDLFEYMPGLGHKYSLSEVNNPSNYADFIAANPEWKKFHAYIKSPDFIENTLAFLKGHHIDLGLKRRRIVSNRKSRHASLYARLRRKTELSARFEFSMMSPQGGHILPHTDGPNKLITLVISMMKPGEWNTEWGGGTDVCLPKDRTLVYNQVNDYMEFADVETIKGFEFHPNQCVLFIKTYNSWHQVLPIKAPEGSAMRKTLTINIESKV
jgi:hypothetical protein